MRDLLSEPIWRARFLSRSVLWLHMIFLARAVGLFGEILKDDLSPYDKIHGIVSWMPLNPDVTWTIICVIASFCGILGWWRQRTNTYLLSLIFSAFVLTLLAWGSATAEAIAPTLVWTTIAVCVIAEVRLAINVQPEDHSDRGAD